MADLIKPGELKERMKKVPEWELEKKHIERTFEFDDFADAIDFVNAVAEVAEEEEQSALGSFDAQQRRPDRVRLRPRGTDRHARGVKRVIRSGAVPKIARTIKWIE